MFQEVVLKNTVIHDGTFSLVWLVLFFQTFLVADGCNTTAKQLILPPHLLLAYLAVAQRPQVWHEELDKRRAYFLDGPKIHYRSSL
jgi:hypothetical protein